MPLARQIGRESLVLGGARFRGAPFAVEEDEAVSPDDVGVLSPKM